MQPFKLLCPKCQSTRTTFARDTTSRWGGFNSGQHILHCETCGTMLYGAPAKDEFDRQMKAAEATRARRAAEALRPQPRLLSNAQVAALTSEAIRGKLCPVR